MIRFVVDEGVDKPVADKLVELGFETYYIAHMMPGVSDVKVLELANSKQAILVTADKDFGELVYRRNLVSHGIILIRLTGSSPSEKAEIVGSFICDHQAEVHKAFSVITKNGVRVRKSHIIKIQP